MDQIALVENEIDDGKSLIDELTRRKIRVVAACWLKEADSDQWYLYISTPLVSKGIAPAYRSVHKIIREMPAPFWIDPFQVKLIGPDDTIAKAVKALYERHPAPLATRIGGKEFGGVSVSGVYIYPPKRPKRRSS